MKGHIGMTGHAPKVRIGPPKKKVKAAKVAELLNISKEQQKYLKAWNVDRYRNVSPGERCVDMFLEAVHDLCEPKDHTLIDFGCGTGRPAKQLDETFKVTPMDFAGNCLDDDVAEYFGDRFVEHDITEKTALRATWGYCTDVMEHLPTDQVDAALGVMFEACENVFFQIATIPDHFGGHPDIQEDLHLTVWDYDRWLKKFADHGVVIHRSMELRHHVIFLVSGYNGFAYDKLKMNTKPEVVWSQMRENFGKGIQQLKVFKEQAKQKVVVLGGGPSLNSYVDEIKEHKKNGAKIVTTNGTYGWAKEHDLWPVTQFIIDARPFNERFVEPVDDDNVYVICSQCHPDLVDKLPPEKTWLFQGNLDQPSMDICNEVLGQMYEDWFPIPGGSTVMLRAIPALFMMGFRDVEVYGFDSCLMGRPVVEVKHASSDINLNGVDIEMHHAYEQKENDIPKDSNRVGLVTVAGKTFAVEGWMLCQAKEFIEFRRRLLGGMDIKVHGDGLIAHCLAKGLDAIDMEDK
jgi:hypothetical protein